MEIPIRRLRNRGRPPGCRSEKPPRLGVFFGHRHDAPQSFGEIGAEQRRHVDCEGGRFDEANMRSAHIPDATVPPATMLPFQGSNPGAIHAKSREAFLRLDAGAMVSESAAVRRVFAELDRVAPTNSTVLLLGETGTGKELFATRIHELSTRRNRAMVRVNCAAIPATLVESELFGREKGAFTDATASQIGRFELANDSTIFLDEIGDLQPEVQVKLLRVLEERKIERLGSPSAIRVDVRIVAATHRNLEEQVAAGAFREDLYYRLNVFPVKIPALRERIEDIPLLVWQFVEEYSRALGKRIEGIGPETMIALQRHPWPGNIRQLRNVVERAMIVADGGRLAIPLPETAAGAERGNRLEDVHKRHIRSVLESVGWRIRGAGGAADRLGLPPTTLETRMAKLGLSRPSRVELTQSRAS